VCEVLSKSTERIDRDEKLPMYAEQGVGHVWIVDPTARALEVYALGDERRWRRVRVYADDARVRAAPFEEIEIDLAKLWAPPLRKP
jgi:Uma2 family endonuclease